MTAKKAVKKAVAKKKAPTARKKAAVSVSVKVQGKTYQAQGATALEALQGLVVRNARGMAILVISHGKATTEKVLPARAVMRLFSPSPTMRQAQIRNLATLFAL